MLENNGSNILTDMNNGNILSYSYCWYSKDLNNIIVDIKNTISDDVNSFIKELTYNIEDIYKWPKTNTENNSYNSFTYNLYYILIDPNYIPINSNKDSIPINSNEELSGKNIFKDQTIDNYFKNLKTNYNNYVNKNLDPKNTNVIIFGDNIKTTIINNIKEIIAKQSNNDNIIEIILPKIDGYYYDKECIDIIKNAINGKN